MSELQFIKVSIIIPAFNSDKFISETLNSVLSQTFSNWECIVIDNGSTDGTKQIVESYVRKDTRFQYHFCEQNGVSFARNKAVEKSTGIYILPLDSDDKIAPTYLEKALKILENNSNLKLVYCDAELFGASQGKWILPDFSFKNLLIENSIFCSALFRKTDFERSGGYNENMKEGFEDWDFWIRFLKDEAKVYKIPEVLFYYRIRKESRNNVLDKEKQIRLRKQIFHNNKEVYERYFELHELIYDLYLTNTEIKKLKTSPEFKMGTILAKPLRLLKKIVTK